jgi:hypothetical protein
MKGKIKLMVYLSSFFLLFLLTGCVEDPVKQALSQLDDLQKAINNKTGDVTAEIDKLQKDLPDEVRSLIEVDIQKLSRDVIGSTATETRCTVNFLRDRFSQSVENIKLKLQRKPMISHKPCFCTVDLPQIDPSSDAKSIQSLNFYGYDFDNLDSSKQLMKAVLVGDSTSKVIDEKYIGRTTSYQMVINIADILPEIASNKYHKIKIFWNGDSTKLSEALISEWKPQTKFDPFQPRTFSWYPPHTGGDCDFDTGPDNWANGQVQLDMRVNGNVIEGRLFYDVMEFGGDNTRVGVNGNGEASAWAPWNTIYTNADPRYELIGFSPAAPPRYPFVVTDHGPKHYYQGGSAVEQFEAFVDEKGCDVANCHVDVLFNNVKAVLRQKQPIRLR